MEVVTNIRLFVHLTKNIVPRIPPVLLTNVNPPDISSENVDNSHLQLRFPQMTSNYELESPPNKVVPCRISNSSDDQAATCFIYTSVFQTVLFADTFWLPKIAADPQFLADVNIVCSDDRHPELKIYTSKLIIQVLR
jgi:hypothetical protein